MSLPTTRLGKAGAKVTRICLGTMGFGAKTWREWVIESKESVPIIKRALDLGINFIDTADVYSIGESERIVGQAIEGRRDDVVLATKVINPMGPGPNDHGLSRKHIVKGLKDSLERLQTDYIDLYQIHRYDPDTELDESLATLSGLVDQGNVHYLGASTMWAWQFALAASRQREKDWHPFVTMQNHYNLVYREEEREMIPLCRNLGVGLLPWSPLARGFLAGPEKRDNGVRARTDGGRAFYRHPQDLEIAKRVDEIAQEKDVSSANIALAWLLHQPGVVAPIVGITRVEQVEDAVEAATLQLSQDELKRLEAPYKPRGITGWYRGGGVPVQHLDEEEVGGLTRILKPAKATPAAGQAR
ncbi:MAG TPA: aldo/keto reductase [Candidatus Thermoplasmatota archaeon]